MEERDPVSENDMVAEKQIVAEKDRVAEPDPAADAAEAGGDRSGEAERRGYGSRHMARQMALQMLFQHDLGGEVEAATIFRRFDRTPYLAGGGPELLDETEEDDDSAPAGGSSPPPKEPVVGERRLREVEEAFSFARRLVTGTLEHRDEIDEMIDQQADNWRLERMPAVDRNILRLAVYELVHEEETPKLVVVDEAIELAKSFSTDQSSRFVNGLLDGLLKEREFPGTMT